VAFSYTISEDVATGYETSRPGQPWKPELSGRVPCTSEGANFCRAIIGRPELSTNQKLLISFFNAGAVPHYYAKAGSGGHVVVASFSW
jgi:hypothetical protein